MNECTADIDREQMRKIQTECDFLTDFIGSEGEIFEGVFDNCDIIDNIQRKGKRKDELVISRRRCIILTNSNFFQREMDKAENKRLEAERKKKETEEKARKQEEFQRIKERKQLESKAKKDFREREKERKFIFNNEKKEQKLMLIEDKANNNKLKISKK